MKRTHSIVIGTLFSLVPIAWPLEWEQRPGFRLAVLPVPRDGQPGFSFLSPQETGILFTNALAAARYRTNQIYLNGSGVAAGDVDGDGWCDLFFCGLDTPNRLYRNLGDWKFADVTEAAGTACPEAECTAAVLADLNGDGALDLLVNTVRQGMYVFRNDGGFRFTNVTPNAGLVPSRGGMTMTTGDIDGDGDLDVYVANYRASALMDIPTSRARLARVQGKMVITHFNGRAVTEPDLTNRFHIDARGQVSERGEPDVLYRNLGNFRFQPVSFTDGTFLDEDGKPLSETPREWGLTASFRDLNQDGAPDLYVCNDFDELDRLWLNDGQGHFRAVNRTTIRQMSWFSMGVDFADVNRDGFDDFLVLDMQARSLAKRLNQLGDPAPLVGLWTDIRSRPQHMRTMLYLNRGDHTFAEIGQLAGVESTDWAWSVAFLDVDLDGWEDALVTNGIERDSRHIDLPEELKAPRGGRALTDDEIRDGRMKFPRFATPNLAFRNRRDLTFEEVGQWWGFNFAGVSNGFALADLDNDGDPDLAVNNMNAAAGIYRNLSSAPRVAVRLKGAAPNGRGIGARLKVTGGPVTQTQEIIAGGRYLSGDEAQRTFAAGHATNRLTLEVSWRNGRYSVVSSVAANSLIEVDEASAAARSPSSAVDASSVKWPRPLFEDASSLVPHIHQDKPFADYARQPLLPRQFSQLGPGVTWSDVNQDGWEDLVIGSGAGGRLGVWLNQRGNSFQLATDLPLSQPVTRDQTTVLAWAGQSGDVVLLAGSANYEDGLAAGACVRLYDLTRKRIEDRLPPLAGSVGPLALADLEADGDLDLFVGGRVLPGQYPQPAMSRLFRNENGEWIADAANQPILDAAGMVNGAVFTDLTGDGFPELVLACDWGPLRIFQNRQGKLTAWNPPIQLVGERSHDSQLRTLDSLTGWWNGVAAGDFDGDGRLDLVAGNGGRNTRFESYRQKLLRLYYGDLDRDGVIDLIEAQFDRDRGAYLPMRQLGQLAKGLPILTSYYDTHAAFAQAGVEEILSKLPGRAALREANWLESTVLINRGDHFLAAPLPIEAQFAPAFGVSVADFDGDGTEDVFLSQNFFAVQPETARYDAGRGLMLLGNGGGTFRPLAGQTSGIMLYGEQRGSAVCDFDRDGRADLAVAQNSAATGLFKNVSARPGLRVRLRGTSTNPGGVGAALRLHFGQEIGPAREIHCGSGYWSQDSLVPVLGTLKRPTQLWVRWPGGKATTVPLPDNAQEIEVDLDGNLRVIR